MSFQGSSDPGNYKHGSNGRAPYNPQYSPDRYTTLEPRGGPPTSTSSAGPSSPSVSLPSIGALGFKRLGKAASSTNLNASGQGSSAVATSNQIASRGVYPNRKSPNPPDMESMLSTFPVNPSADTQRSFPDGVNKAVASSSSSTGVTGQLVPKGASPNPGR